MALKNNSPGYLIVDVKAIHYYNMETKAEERKGKVQRDEEDEVRGGEKASGDILCAELHLRGFDYRLGCHLLRMLVTPYMIGSIFDIGCAPPAAAPVHLRQQ